MTTYYIDNSAANASDKNSGTSASSPFADLAAVSKLHLQPGDMIAIKAGTVYNLDAAGAAVLTLTASGTAENPITITSYGTGAKPIINNTSTNMYSDGIDLNDSQYVTIDGVAFHGAHQAAINVASTSSYITVENSEMTNVGEGVLLNGTHNLVTENYIHDLNMVKNTPTDTTSAATIAATSTDDYGANGVVIGNSYNEVSFNKIVNAKAPSYDFGTDGGGIELYGTMTNVSVHDNYVAGSQGFMEAGGPPNSTLSNITITNNVALNNGNFIDFHNGGGNESNFINVLVSNNTIVDQTNASKEMATIFFDKPGVTAAQVNVTNNIISLNDGDSVFKQVGTYHSNNLIYLQAKDTHLYNDWAMTLGSGEQYGNPGLNNTASGDFTPTASGLAQAVGAAISAELQAVISGTAITSSNAVSSTNYYTVSSYDASGALTAMTVSNPDGSKALTNYVSGQGYAVQQSFYNATGTLVELNQFAANGTLLFKQVTDASGTTTTDHYSAAGVLQSEGIVHADGSREYTNDAVTGQGYASEHLAYNAAGNMIEDDQYAASGALLTKVVLNASGTITDHYGTNGTLLNERIVHADGSFDFTNDVVTGQAYASEHLAYNAAGNMIEDDQYAASGVLLTKVVVNTSGTTTDHYGTNGALLSERTVHADGSIDYTNDAVTGQAYAIEHSTYDASGKLVEDDRTTAAGTLIYKEVVGSTGTEVDTYSTAGAHLTEMLTHADGSKDLWTFGAARSTEHDTYSTAGVRTVLDLTSANGSHTTTALAGGLTLASNAGVSDVFTSFGNDTFTFATGSGADTIKSFHAGNAAGHDTIQISTPGIDTFAQLQALMTTAADHVSTIIHLSAADTITIDHVAPAALTAADFHLVHAPAAHA